MVEGQDVTYTDGKSTYAASGALHHGHPSVSHHSQSPRHLESVPGFGREQGEYIYHGRGPTDIEHSNVTIASASSSQQNVKAENSEIKFIQNNSHMINFSISHPDARAMHSGLELIVTDGFSENHDTASHEPNHHPTPHLHPSTIQQGLIANPPVHRHHDLHLQTNEGKSRCPAL